MVVDDGTRQCGDEIFLKTQSPVALKRLESQRNRVSASHALALASASKRLGKGTNSKRLRFQVTWWWWAGRAGYSEGRAQEQPCFP